jgi:hypothetical protein
VKEKHLKSKRMIAISIAPLLYGLMFLLAGTHVVVLGILFMALRESLSTETVLNAFIWIIASGITCFLAMAAVAVFMFVVRCPRCDRRFFRIGMMPTLTTKCAWCGYRIES